MKTKILFLSLAFIVTLVSCSKEADLTPKATNSQTKEGLKFGELKVNLPQGYDEKILSLTMPDLQDQFYSSKTGSLSRVKSSDDMGITLDRMAIVAKKVVDKYPNFDSLTAEDIAIIKHDFNNTNEETINRNIDVIDSFYNALKRYDLVVALSKENAVVSKVKSASNSNIYSSLTGKNISSQEFWLLVWNPTYVDPTNRATDKARAYTDLKFTKHDFSENYYWNWQTEADAFRHVIWNSLICEYVGYQMTSIDKCVAWAKKFTDAHEAGGVNDGSMTTTAWELDRAMDEHNNTIGQNYFKSVAWTYKNKGWFQPTRVACPTSDRMADAVFLMIKSSKKVTVKNEIYYYPSNTVHIINYKW